MIRVLLHHIWPLPPHLRHIWFPAPPHPADCQHWMSTMFSRKQPCIYSTAQHYQNRVCSCPFLFQSCTKYSQTQTQTQLLISVYLQHKISVVKCLSVEIFSTIRAQKWKVVDVNPVFKIAILTSLSKIRTNVGLLLSFFTTIRVSIMRISHFFDTSRVWRFDGTFVFNTIWVYKPYKNLHT